jgi:hypothetical protein
MRSPKTFSAHHIDTCKKFFPNLKWSVYSFYSPGANYGRYHGTLTTSPKLIVDVIISDSQDCTTAEARILLGGFNTGVVFLSPPGRKGQGLDSALENLQKLWKAFNQQATKGASNIKKVAKKSPPQSSASSPKTKRKR